jgi:ABC-type hemin transport system substrate-binding protein
MPSTEHDVNKYSKALEAIAQGTVKVVQSKAKDPTPKIREKLKDLDSVVRNLKKAARAAAREKRDMHKSSVEDTHKKAGAPRKVKVVKKSKGSVEDGGSDDNACRSLVVS